MEDKQFFPSMKNFFSCSGLWKLLAKKLASKEGLFKLPYKDWRFLFCLLEKISMSSGLKAPTLSALKKWRWKDTKMIKYSAQRKPHGLRLLEIEDF